MNVQYGYSSAEKNIAICRKELDMISNGNFRSNGYEECQNMQFLRICGITRFWEYEENLNISTLSGDILNSFVRHGIPFAYVIIGDQDGINVYVGTMKVLLESLKTSFESTYPGIDIENVPDKLPFMATSCCPAWSVMAKKLFPEYRDCVSMTLTPMVLTGRLIKLKDPEAKVVFIGPCAAKKLEASRKSVRSDIDFVLTFEEMMGVFEAKNIDLETIEEEKEVSEASTDGRNFAIAGGVAQAVVNVIKQMYPERTVKVESAQGLRECKKLMTLAKAGKYNGYLLEGMACPGGCVAGAGTLQAINKSTMAVKQYAKNAEYAFCCETDYLKDLEELGK